MIAQSAHSTAPFWDGIARKYAASPVANMDAYRATLDRTRAHLSPTDRVMEIGAGTSSTALHLAPHVGTYLATDISAEMVAIGREKRDAAGLSTLRIEQGTLGDPVTTEGTQDAVLAFSLLHLVPDLDTALRQIHAMLEPGGLFISKTPCLGGVFRVMMPALAVMRAFGKAPGLLWFTPRALERAVVAAGFEIVEADTDPGRMPRRFLVARKL
jgi:ubiquinone/menaquinone biosynthesis C-methylase UbiE